MAKATPIPGLEPGTSFGDAAATAVSTRAAEVFAHAAGATDTADIERVHDMRVATRRLRAVLEIFAPCFPAKQHKRLLREVRDLADALGARRDPDVAIETLTAIGGDLEDEDRPGVDGLVDELRSEQAGANLDLADVLDRVAAGHLEQRLAALAASARGQAISEVP